MSVIGSLSVNVLARTGMFEKGMKDSRREVSRFADGVDRASRTITNMGRLMTAGIAMVGVQRLTGAFLEQAAAIDGIAKTSAKLDIATEKLIGLQHAAEQNGIATNTLDMGLQRMVRRVAQAAQGTGEAVKALEDLNLNAAELNKLSPDQQFYRIADALNAVENQSDKVATAFKLFDSEGVALVNMTREGAKGLAAMQAEAEKLGMTFSKEEAAKVEKFNDELDRLKKLIGGFTRDFVIDVAPAAMEAVEGLKLIMQGVANKTSGMAGGAFKPFADGPNANNSLIYRGTFALAQWAGVGVAGNDALTDAERLALQKRRSQTINEGVARRQDVMSNFRRTGIWKDSQQLEAERKGLMKYIRKNVTETADTAKKFLDVVREKTPKLADSIQQTATNVNQASRALWFQQAAKQLGFKFGKPDKEKETKLVRQMFQSGAGGALEYGTAEAFRAARANQNPVVTIVREQLAEAKRQTDFLKQIAEQEPIVIQEEG